MRITNKRVVPQKRDPRTGDTLVWRDMSNERPEKPRIKVASKDKGQENVFRRPPSKMKIGPKPSNVVRIGATKTMVGDGGREPRPPSHDNKDPFRRSGSRSGKVPPSDLSIMTRTAYKGKNFQLKKDKQLYEKIWNNKEDEAKRNTPSRKPKAEDYESTEKMLTTDYKIATRNAFYINESRQRGSNLCLNDQTLQHQERKTSNLRDSQGNSSQKVKPPIKVDIPEERQMFRIKSRAQNSHHNAAMKTYDEARDVDSLPVVADSPSEKVVFETFEQGEEELLTELKSLLTNLSNPLLKDTQSCSEDHLKRCFNQPTWARVWKQNKYMGAKVVEENIIGILIYQLDTNHFKTRRMLITHFSVQNFDSLDKYLREGIDYIFNNDSCSEIHFHFNHIREEDKLVFPAELKEALKKGGMKWRMVVNNQDGSRQTVFDAKRNPQIHNEAKDSAVCHEPIKQISFTLLTDCQIANLRDLMQSERQFRGSENSFKCLMTGPS
jgi:hypothetical protein